MRSLCTCPPDDVHIVACGNLPAKALLQEPSTSKPTQTLDTVLSCACRGGRC